MGERLEDALFSGEEEAEEATAAEGGAASSSAGARDDAIAAPDVRPATDDPETVAAKPKPRPDGIIRDLANRVVINIPDIGEIHYYRSCKRLEAFCKHRAGKHYDGCRRSCTCAPARRGSGRPIGMLVAWLQLADAHEDKTSHVHWCIPSLAERQAARQLFQGLPGSDEFLAFEKQQDDGSPEEPLVV